MPPATFPDDALGIRPRQMYLPNPAWTIMDADNVDGIVLLANQLYST